MQRAGQTLRAIGTAVCGLCAGLTGPAAQQPSGRPSFASGIELVAVTFWQ